MLKGSEHLQAVEKPLRVHPSYANIQSILYHSLSEYQRKQGRTQPYIDNALSSLKSEDPRQYTKKHPSSVPFPLQKLSDNNLAFLLAYAPNNLPFYESLEKEKSKRIDKDPAFAVKSFDDIRPSQEILEEISFRPQK